MTQNFTLTWHSYASHFQNIISELYTTGELSDVTLVCDDQVRYKVHKFVLKAYRFQKSTWRKDRFKINNLSKGVNHTELKPILEFIYFG